GARLLGRDHVQDERHLPIRGNPRQIGGVVGDERVHVGDVRRRVERHERRLAVAGGAGRRRRKHQGQAGDDEGGWVPRAHGSVLSLVGSLFVPGIRGADRFWIGRQAPRMPAPPWYSRTVSTRWRRFRERKRTTLPGGGGAPARRNDPQSTRDVPGPASEPRNAARFTGSPSAPNCFFPDGPMKPIVARPKLRPAPRPISTTGRPLC